MNNPGHSGIGMTSARTRERLIKRLTNQGIKSLAVLDRIRNVPRHLFVDEALESRAYEDTALPIGHGQTISQPFVVARMTEALLRDGPLKKVLEVGTGCGYQTAVLAPLVGSIYSIERIKQLADRASVLLKEIGIRNVQFSHSDGWEGLPRFQPFDGIIVAAAPQEIPQLLLGQLAQGGRMVIPVGPSRNQDLVMLTRKGDTFEREVLDKVSFVPLLAGLKGTSIYP